MANAIPLRQQTAALRNKLNAAPAPPVGTRGTSAAPVGNNAGSGQRGGSPINLASFRPQDLGALANIVLGLVDATVACINGAAHDAQDQIRRALESDGSTVVVIGGNLQVLEPFIVRCTKKLWLIDCALNAVTVGNAALTPWLFTLGTNTCFDLCLCNSQVLVAADPDAANASMLRMPTTSKASVVCDAASTIEVSGPTGVNSRTTLFRLRNFTAATPVSIPASLEGGTVTMNARNTSMALAPDALAGSDIEDVQIGLVANTDISGILTGIVKCGVKVDISHENFPAGTMPRWRFDEAINGARFTWVGTLDDTTQVAFPLLDMDTSNEAEFAEISQTNSFTVANPAIGGPLQLVRAASAGGVGPAGVRHVDVVVTDTAALGSPMTVALFAQNAEDINVDAAGAASAVDVGVTADRRASLHTNESTGTSVTSAEASADVVVRGAFTITAPLITSLVLRETAGAGALAHSIAANTIEDLQTYGNGVASTITITAAVPALLGALGMQVKKAAFNPTFTVSFTSGVHIGELFHAAAGLMTFASVVIAGLLYALTDADLMAFTASTGASSVGTFSGTAVSAPANLAAYTGGGALATSTPGVALVHG